jgi:hypothetical protein
MTETNRNFNRIDTGTLGENSYKERDNQPDVTGKLDAMSAEVIAAIAAGKQVRLAGWLKEGRDGKFLSLKVSVMRERAPSNPQMQARPLRSSGPPVARSQHPLGSVRSPGRSRATWRDLVRAMSFPSMTSTSCLSELEPQRNANTNRTRSR